MSVGAKILAAILLVLLAATGYGLWSMNLVAPAATKSARSRQPLNPSPLIDQATFLTAQRLARLANTADEQSLGQSAVRLADHELDLAFAAALRQLEAHPPVLSPEAEKIQ